MKKVSIKREFKKNIASLRLGQEYFFHSGWNKDPRKFILIRTGKKGFNLLDPKNSKCFLRRPIYQKNSAGRKIGYKQELFEICLPDYINAVWEDVTETEVKNVIQKTGPIQYKQRIKTMDSTKPRISVAISEIKDLCSTALSKIEKINKKHDDIYVERYCEHLNSKRFNKWRKKVYNLEETKKYIEKEIFNSFPHIDKHFSHYPSHNGYSTESLAENILLTCKNIESLSSPKVSSIDLDIEDFNSLCYWSKNEDI